MKQLNFWTIMLFLAATIPKIRGGLVLVVLSGTSEHSANFTVFSVSNAHQYKMFEGFHTCRDADLNPLTGAECDVTLSTGTPNGGVIATWNNIPSGAERILDDITVNYDDGGSSVDNISLPYNIPLCTVVEPPANVTVEDQSVSEYVISITNHDNVHSSGYFYMVDIWNGTGWDNMVSANLTVNVVSNSTINTSVTLNSKGTLFRVVVKTDDACDGYTLSDNFTKNHVTGLETPSIEPLHILTKDNSTMCFLWQYVDTTSNFNLVTFRMKQSGSSEHHITKYVDGLSSGVICMTDASGVDASQTVDIQFSIGINGTADGYDFSKHSNALEFGPLNTSDFSIIESVMASCDEQECTFDVQIAGSISAFSENIYFNFTTISSDSSDWIRFNLSEMDVCTLSIRYKCHQNFPRGANQTSYSFTLDLYVFNEMMPDSWEGNFTTVETTVGNNSNACRFNSLGGPVLLGILILDVMLI